MPCGPAPSRRTFHGRPPTLPAEPSPPGGRSTGFLRGRPPARKRSTGAHRQSPRSVARPSAGASRVDPRGDTCGAPPGGLPLGGSARATGPAHPPGPLRGMPLGRSVPGTGAEHLSGSLRGPPLGGPVRGSGRSIRRGSCGGNAAGWFRPGNRGAGFRPGCCSPVTRTECLHGSHLGVTRGALLREGSSRGTASGWSRPEDRGAGFRLGCCPPVPPEGMPARVAPGVTRGGAAPGGIPVGVASGAGPSGPLPGGTPPRGAPLFGIPGDPRGLRALGRSGARTVARARTTLYPYRTPEPASTSYPHRTAEPHRQRSEPAANPQRFVRPFLPLRK